MLINRLGVIGAIYSFFLEALFPLITMTQIKHSSQFLCGVCKVDI